jgi:uncharacterized protein (DUF305 family)
MRALVALAALALAGCEGGGDPVESALREAAAANHAAATRETPLDDATAPPSDIAVVRGLIASERQALTAAEIALARASDPEARRLVEAVRDGHRARIAELEAWRRAE